MTGQKPLHLSILVGRGAHPQAVMDDLWSRATALADHNGYQMTGTVVYTYDDGPQVTPADERVKVVTLEKSPAGRVISLLADAARKPGPVGIAGRLARDNEAPSTARCSGTAGVSSKLSRCSATQASRSERR